MSIMYNLFHNTTPSTRRFWLELAAIEGCRAPVIYLDDIPHTPPADDGKLEQWVRCVRHACVVDDASMRDPLRLSVARVARLVRVAILLTDALADTDRWRPWSLASGLVVSVHARAMRPTQIPPWIAELRLRRPLEDTAT